jgi:hypothetical protein
MIKITNPPPSIQLIFLSYDLNSSSSKVHFRRILHEKTEHKKERKWKFKTTVETDKPNNIRRQKKGSYVPPCPLRNTGAMKQSCAGQSASARKVQSVFGHKLASELAFLAGNKERKAQMERRGRRRRIDWLYTYSYISRVYTLKHFLKKILFALFCCFSLFKGGMLIFF